MSLELVKLGKGQNVHLSLAMQCVTMTSAATSCRIARILLTSFVIARIRKVSSFRNSCVKVLVLIVQLYLVRICAWELTLMLGAMHGDAGRARERKSPPARLVAMAARAL